MPKHTPPKHLKTGGGWHRGRAVNKLPLLLLLLVACALVATGCGEASGGASGASSTATQHTPATTAAASSDSGGAASAGLGTTGAQAHQRSTNARHATTAAPVRKSKAHLVLPPPGSHPEPKLTASERATVSVADISLSSPAIKRVANRSAYTLDREYTCHGADHSPPLRWSGVPANTKELALFAISTRPVNGKLFFDWALANLKPSLKGLQAGTLPAGAVLGESSSGHAFYSICPASGKRESYVFVLYALPTSLAPTAGFDPTTLRHQAMQLARHTGLLVGTYGA
jgi:phosphatidylethanolamine-binding protein (PEBP) family uncharacterized protein